MQITPKLRQQLKAKAHKLKPIVFIGINGITENVTKELDRALNDHELIKIRIQENDREVRKAIFEELCGAVNATGLQLIGSVGIIYRKNEE